MSKSLTDSSLSFPGHSGDDDAVVTLDGPAAGVLKLSQRSSHDLTRVQAAILVGDSEPIVEADADRPIKSRRLLGGVAVRIARCERRSDAATLGVVDSVRALYGRFRDLIHEGARFGAVGLLGLLITDGCANLLRFQAGLGRLSSVAIAIVFATAVTFAANRYWVYPHRERVGLGRETALFFVVNAVGLAISEVPVGLTYPLHLDNGVSYNAAVICGIALATLFRYWSYRNWVWRAKSTSSGVRPHESSSETREYTAAERRG